MCDERNAISWTKLLHNFSVCCDKAKHALTICPGTNTQTLTHTHTHTHAERYMPAYLCKLRLRTARNELADKSSRRPQSAVSCDSGREKDGEGGERGTISAPSLLLGIKIKLIYGSANILANKSVQNKPTGPGCPLGDCRVEIGRLNLCVRLLHKD